MVLKTDESYGLR